jgi:hypothetical protein
MGRLLGLPPSVNLDSLGLTPRGRMLARAFQDYGAYVVDTAGGGLVGYAEPSAEPLLADMRADLRKLLPHLRPVLNNAPSRVGGGGTPRAPLAPPISP